MYHLAPIPARHIDHGPDALSVAIETASAVEKESTMSDPKDTPDTDVTAPEEVDLTDGTDEEGTPVENPSG